MRIANHPSTPPTRAAAPSRETQTPTAPVDGYADGRDYPSWLIPATIVGSLGAGAGMSLLTTVAPPAAGAVALTAGVGTAVACWRSADGDATAPLGILVGIGVGGAVGALGGAGAALGRQWAEAMGGPVLSSLAGGVAVAAGLAAFCVVCNQS